VLRVRLIVSSTLVQGTFLGIFTILIMLYMDQVENKGSPGLNLVWGVSLMSQIAAVTLAIFLPLIATLADAFGRPIPAEHMDFQASGHCHRNAVGTGRYIVVLSRY
jgi:hypothetical protein